MRAARTERCAGKGELVSGSPSMARLYQNGGCGVKLRGRRGRPELVKDGHGYLPEERPDRGVKQYGTGLSPEATHSPCGFI